MMWKHSKFTGPAPERLSCFRKYNRDETFDDIASTCCVHFKLFATCTPSSLNIITRSTGYCHCLLLRVTGSGGSLRIEPITLAFLLSCSRLQSCPFQLPDIQVHQRVTACCWLSTCLVPAANWSQLDRISPISTR